MVLIDKETGKSFTQMEETGHKKEYASKGVAGTALGLGIAGTALWLLNGGANHLGCFGGCVGNNTFGITGASMANAAGIAAEAENTKYIERKQCADFVTLISDMYEKAAEGQRGRFVDRERTNSELFGIYKTTRDGFDVLSAKHNADSFNLYKYSRDSHDKLAAEVSELRTEIAVMKAVRPYQDALIQCDIRQVADQANFNLYRRTCKMINGQVILPEKPVVSGFGSYNTCPCNTVEQ